MAGTNQKPINERLRGRLLCLKEIRLRVTEQDIAIPLQPLSGAQPNVRMCVDRTCANIVWEVNTTGPHIRTLEKQKLSRAKPFV